MLILILKNLSKMKKNKNLIKLKEIRLKILMNFELFLHFLFQLKLIYIFLNLISKK